jgi:L-fuculose-phosphate aldolase
MQQMHARIIAFCVLRSASMDVNDVRRDVCAHARKMWEAGLVVAAAGNVSRRADERLIAITPSSVPYEEMTDADVVLVDLGTGEAVGSLREPSYELPMHLAVYRSHPEVGAIVHTHSPHVTALSVLRRPLPPIIDEMLVYFGGPVEVTDYAFTGTEAVGANVVRKLGDRTAVLLANHGNVCVGRDLAHALRIAVVMEACAETYLLALRAGEPVALPNESLVAGRRLFEARNKL